MAATDRRLTVTQAQVIGLTSALAGKVNRAEGSGPPEPHAETHETGGSDPVSLLELDGYPGGTTTFLRADGSFATPTAGVPDAHHATHEPGGADAILNLDASVLTSGTVPDARLSGNVQMKPIAAADLPAHATRHQVGGSDPLAVTALAGYPGGTTTFLRADGSFAAPPSGGVVAGANTQVQFNDGGVFGGDAGLTYNKTTDALTVGGLLTVNGFGQHSFSASGTGSQSMLVANPTSGVGNYAAFYAQAGTNTLGLYALSEGYATSNQYVAGSGVVQSYGPGGLSIVATHAAGVLRFYTGGSTERMRLDAAGLLTTGPVLVGSSLRFTAASPVITQSTVDGADNSYVLMAGGGDAAASRGAYLYLSGNEHSSPGHIVMHVGNVAGANWLVYRGDSTLALQMLGDGHFHFTTSNASQMYLDGPSTGGFVAWLWSGNIYGVVGSSVQCGIGGNFNDFGIRAFQSLYLGASNAIFAPRIYADTNSPAANVLVEADGRLRRSTSSRRSKTNIAPLTDWAFLLKLEPVTFTSRTSGTPHMGLIAEDVAAIEPRLAVVGPDGPDEVAYTHLTAPLVAAVQALHARLAALERMTHGVQ